jgi:hypothetical protein
VHIVSKTGAAFEVTSPVGIPEKFTLVIPGDGLNFACRVIWRLGLSIGVKFDRTLQPLRYPLRGNR